MTTVAGRWVDGGDINIADDVITDGKGNSLPDRRGLFVVHAALLHTGKVLWFCGHVEDGHYVLKSYLFDYQNRAARLPAQEFPLHNPNLARGGGHLHVPQSGTFHADLFCSHMVHTRDGKLLVLGGSDPDYFVAGAPAASHSSVGEPYVYAFDADTATWQVVQTGSEVCRLKQGRWYPTAVALGDGRIAVFSGRREHKAVQAGTSIASLVELLTPRSNVLEYRRDDLAHPNGSEIPLPIYPGLHLAPDGRIYYTHTTWGLEIPAPPNTLSLGIGPSSVSADWTIHSGIHPTQIKREEGMSVLLPPAHEGRILLFGGSEAQNSSNQPLRQFGGAYARLDPLTKPRSSEILRTIPGLSWVAGPQLNEARINGHAVILPNKKVLIFGGHNGHKWNSRTSSPSTQPSLPSEQFDPATDSLTVMAPLNHPRMYHAAAVLLPDGTVLVAGGADPNELELTHHASGPRRFDYNESTPNPWQGPRMGAGAAYNRKDYEIFEPTYCFVEGSDERDDSQRPDLNDIQRGGASVRRANYDEIITIVSPQANSIDAVALIRPGAATHHTDSEQRYVALEPITHISPTELSVTLPSNQHVAPQGYYMLWIIAGGVPCKKAIFFLLSGPLPVPPSSGGKCIIVTAAMGSRDAFEVRYLTALRADISSSGEVGRIFIGFVNALYYAVAPLVVSAMRRDPNLRQSIRDALVLPSVRFIRAAERLSFGRPGVLMALLGAIGLAGISLLPLLAVVVAARTLLHKVGTDTRHRPAGRIP